MILLLSGYEIVDLSSISSFPLNIPDDNNYLQGLAFDDKDNDLNELSLVSYQLLSAEVSELFAGIV